MSDPIGDNGNQTAPVHSISATPFASDAAPSAPRDDRPPRHDSSGPIPRGTIFGAFVGLFTGALTAAACCWMSESNDFLWIGAAIGAAIGIFGGAVIGGVERRRRGDMTRPDIATIIGGLFGLASAFFVFLGGMGGVRGNVSALGLMGMAFIFPMVGIFIGAFFDRSYEAARNAKRRDAVVFSAIGVAASLGLLWFMIAYPCGDTVADVIRPLKGLLYTKFREEPEMRYVTIDKVVLKRDGDRVFSGSFDAVLDGRTKRYLVDVQTSEHSISAQWHPVDE